MAEKQRVPNAERRRLAREQRKQQQAEAAKRASRQRIISSVAVGVAGAVVAALLVTALSGGDTPGTEPIVLGRDEVSAARTAAGCEVVAEGPDASPATHYEAATSPPADQLYDDPRPTNSGSHFAVQHPIIRRLPDNQLEERALTHNLEHGAVIAWYDPQKLDNAPVADMEDWAQGLMAAGFIAERAGTGIFLSPYVDPGITSGKAVAYRAWGYSLDCDAWDPTVANSVVLDHFGSNGTAPEGSFAPFPSEQMRYREG